jgi:hypothetical protein
MFFLKVSLEDDHVFPIAAPQPAGHHILDVERPAPFTPEDSVIFICIDVESFERNHNLITEIGIATLDTLDLATISPGQGGINWLSTIRARHFRIKEYEHLKNQDFIQSCAECFQFGLASAIFWSF